MSGNLDASLKSLIEPIVESYGLQLWGVRYRVGKNTAHLQVFVEGENGVDIEACGAITNALSPILDSADLIDEAYILEVSSPGVDRILFNLDQLALYINHHIKFEFKLLVNSSDKLEGKLISIDGDNLNIEILNTETKNNQIIPIAFSNIALARLVPDYDALMKANKK